MKLELKKVRIAKFEEFINQEYVVHCIINDNTYVDKICIVNDKTNQAIDIDNSEVYRILNRKNGRIVLAPNDEKIDLMVNYGLEVVDIDLSRMTFIEQKIILMKARKCLKKYKDNNHDSVKILSKIINSRK